MASNSAILAPILSSWTRCNFDLTVPTTIKDSTHSQADDEDVEQAMPEDDPGETLSQYEPTSNETRGTKFKKQQRAGKKRERNSTSKTQPHKSARLGIRSRKAVPKPAAKPTYDEDEDDEEDLVLPPEQQSKRLQSLQTGFGAPRKSAPQGGERRVPQDSIFRTGRGSRSLLSQARVIIDISDDDDTDGRATPEHCDDPGTFEDGDTSMDLKNEHDESRADRGLLSDDRSRLPVSDLTSASRPYRGRQQVDRDQYGSTRSLSGANVTSAQRANSRIQGDSAIAAGRDIKREYADASQPPRLPTPAGSSQPPIQRTLTDVGYGQKDEQSDSDNEVFRQLQEIRLVGKLKRRGRLDCTMHSVLHDHIYRASHLALPCLASSLL
ncbi:hypothetical protein LTR78_007183 [Recurvomyces mirabilis]|uniref:Uncharacterized protein n=1 Tax=Recurvomyces mirabilis TaxID=574656 RepID=A0AAE0WJG0_9PEZI|nr:hypothetical protein LTR78_007183 [Recurvomyces mirabilis]KAK5155574.1 hypothetical protein LTS14_005835 [Recurvomyces mirabilis]